MEKQISSNILLFLFEVNLGKKEKKNQCPKQCLQMSP